MDAGSEAKDNNGGEHGGDCGDGGGKIVTEKGEREMKEGKKRERGEGEGHVACISRAQHHGPRR